MIGIEGEGAVQRLQRFPGPALFTAGLPPARNYAANRYPFRATSHFLYFTGAPLPGAALLFAEGKVSLFWHPASSPATAITGRILTRCAFNIRALRAPAYCENSEGKIMSLHSVDS